MTTEEPITLGQVRLEFAGGLEIVEATDARLVTVRSEHGSITGLPVKQSEIRHVEFRAKLSTFLPPGSHVRVESQEGKCYFDARMVNAEEDGVAEIHSDGPVFELVEADVPHVAIAR